MNIQLSTGVIQNTSPIVVKHSNHKNNTIVNKDTFTKTSSPSFKGNFGNEVEHFARRFFKKEHDIEDCFNKTFTALKNDTNITKFDGFKEVSDIYDKKGMRGLLYEFWKAQSNPEVNKILSECPPYEELLLADNEKIGGLFIQNQGRHGFIDNLIDNKNAPRDLKFTFISKHGTSFDEVSLSLGKNQNLILEQSNFTGSSRCEYYSTVGSIRKIETENDTTYYTKSGKENFLRNMFAGKGIGPQP